ncbi:MULTISPECIES: AEC family transporter [Tepidiphilus]|uniref:Predicted permease n=1 Tax=Tepidiphilus thermophilus TaxID=876478 RepID=A0A0K6INK4_9PROT|nr:MULTISPECIES: AEC family transporter [Tepidiphilus]CUB04669.1 Predicted permease [Tepidiphilus thermophilus]
MLAQRLVEILFPLFALVALGYVIGKRHRPELSGANRLNMDVFTPALVFAALAGRQVDVLAYLPLVLAALVLVLGSGALGWWLAHRLQEDPRTLAPPMMFNNCGNLGLPLALLTFGEQALAPMVVLFIVSNLLHFSLGVWLLDRRARLSHLWRVPSVLAAVAGLAVGAAGWTVWPPLLTTLKMLGDISIPLMLFGLGVRLAETPIRAWRLGVIVALARPLSGMALAAAMIGLYQLMDGAWRLEPLQAALLLLFGALPPAVLNYLFAERYGQEPDKVASIVLVGNLASVAFLPLALAAVLAS